MLVANPAIQPQACIVRMLGRITGDITSMHNLGVAANIGPQGHNGVEVLWFRAIQAEHVVYEPHLQEGRELHTASSLSVIIAL